MRRPLRSKRQDALVLELFLSPLDQTKLVARIFRSVQRHTVTPPSDRFTKKRRSTSKFGPWRGAASVLVFDGGVEGASGGVKLAGAWQQREDQWLRAASFKLCVSKTRHHPSAASLNRCLLQALLHSSAVALTRRRKIRRCTKDPYWDRGHQEQETHRPVGS
jgi:hypothetical protein